MPQKCYRIYPSSQVIGLKNYLATEKVNIPFASMINGEFVLSGDKKIPMMWKLSIIVDHLIIEFYKSKELDEKLPPSIQAKFSWRSFSNQ
jgi:hypothetical protein